MFTTWEQVREWIEDNNFERWIFYTKNPDGRDKDKAYDKLIDSNAYPSDREDKLAMTEKYLRNYGGRVWGVGYKSATYMGDGTICEARIESAMPAAGIGAAQTIQPIDEDALRQRITRELKAEMAAQRYEEEKKQFAAEKKKFEEDKAGVIGALVEHFAPYIGVIRGLNGMKANRLVAGVDTETPTDADPMQPLHARAQEPEAPQEPEEQEQEIFTDEESEQLFDLMARFKKVEPDYLQLIEAVVTMAENGDSTYTMAKGFLLK